MNDVDPYTTLTEKEIEKSREAFSAFDRDNSGAIDKDELRKVLEEMGQKPSDEEIFKMINEVDQSNKGEIQFRDFLKVIAYHKDMQKNDDEEDTLMAFLAMGGGPGKEGAVDAKKLIAVVKGEFNMTIDIETLITDIDTDKSGVIEYEEFKNLLSN